MLKATVGDKISFWVRILLIIGIVWQLIRQRKARKENEKLKTPLTEEKNVKENVGDFKEECPTIDEGEMTPVKIEGKKDFNENEKTFDKEDVKGEELEECEGEKEITIEI